MNNPIFMIGVILMALFIMSQVREEGLGYRENLTPTSCKAVLVKLDRRIPETWKTECRGNNLNVRIKKTEQPGAEALGEDPTAEQVLALTRELLYRQLANDLITIARNSPEDNLEQTDLISIKLLHPAMEIGALTEGRFIVKFATLTDLDLIREHLRETVQVQETIKARP